MLPQRESPALVRSPLRRLMITFGGCAILLGHLAGGGLEEAWAVVGRYPQGAAMSMAHDPLDPSRAVLEPGPAMPDALLYDALAAVLGFLWGGLILLRPLPPVAAPR